MSCELCNSECHSFIDCRDESIFKIKQKLKTHCIKIHNYANNTLNTYNEFENMVKRLSLPMLKALLHNTKIFLNDKKFDNTGGKYMLEGKVIYLFITNARRQYPTRSFEELIESHKETCKENRKLIFNRQIYWSKIVDGNSHTVATKYSELYTNAMDECYDYWVTMICDEVDEIIDNVFYGISEIGVLNFQEFKFQELVRSNLQSKYNSFILKEVNYNIFEQAYLKKQITSYLLLSYETYIVDEPEIDPNIYSFKLKSKIYLRPIETKPLCKFDIQFIPYCDDYEVDKFGEYNFDNYNEFNCNVCSNTKQNNDGCFILSCKHKLCGACMSDSIKEYRTKSTSPICNICSEVITIISLKDTNECVGRDDVWNLCKNY